jgi:hypothetical protein
MKAPEPYESDLEANQVACLDCAHECKAEDTYIECNSCGSDALEYRHVSTSPLGYDDDHDFKIAGRFGRPDMWVYYAKETGR